MTHRPGHTTGRPSSTAAKAAYSKAARKKLVDSRAKLDGIAVVLQQAVATGRLRRSRRLKLSLDAVEANFVAAETQLRRLQKSGEDDWEEQRVGLETAWEDLGRAVRHLAALFSDSS